MAAALILTPTSELLIPLALVTEAGGPAHSEKASSPLVTSNSQQ